MQRSFGSALQSYAVLLRDPHFVGLSLIGGFGVASFVCGIAVMGVLSTLANQEPLPMVAGIAGSAALACAFAWGTLRRGSPAGSPRPTRSL